MNGLADKLEGLTKDIFEYFDIKLTDLVKSAEGYSNESYQAILNGTPVFLRVANKQLGSVAYAYGLAQSAGVPVPKVLHHLYHDDLEYEMLIVEKARGISLNDFQAEPETMHLIYCNMGSVLRKLHNTSVSGFGSFVLRDNTFHGKHDSWKEYVNHKKRDAQILLHNSIVTSKEYDQIESIYEFVASQKPHSVFTHYDFHGSHIFVDKENVSDVIDFSRAGGGDALYDAANSLYYLSDNQIQSFIEGYGDIKKDIVDKYILFIAANKAVWSTENKFESRTHANKNLRRVIGP